MARRDRCCEVSGFLPIHAVVANRKLGMYDFLTRGRSDEEEIDISLPPEMRADPEQVACMHAYVHACICACMHMCMHTGGQGRPGEAAPHTYVCMHVHAYRWPMSAR